MTFTGIDFDYADYMSAEETQEIGRKGVATLKRWLEATTYITLPFDAYGHRIDCTVHTLDGQKIFDLAGHMLGDEKKDPIRIECKKYSSAGIQGKEFKKFLSIAYSNALYEKREYGKYRETHFYWVTFHPFSLAQWSKLETFGYMKSALQAHPSYLGDVGLDEQLAIDVVGRVTVLVFNPKQEKLSLTNEELNQIRPLISRQV